MDPTQEAIEYLELCEAGDKFPYREVAKMLGVDRTTLSRRHRGVQRSHRAQAQHQLVLNPQQEEKLVKYIERCTRDGLPPTRSMLQNLGNAVAQWEVSDSWITRFLHRHIDKLTNKWSTGMDRERHLVDSKRKYELYFNLLRSKMCEHGVDERNTYTHTHNLFTPGGRAERATKAGLLLHCLCYIAASLAPVSSLTRSFMPLVVQVKALACYLGRLFSVPCLSSGACGLVLQVAD